MSVRRRRRWIAAAGVLLAVLVAAPIVGCTSVVRAPDRVEDPGPVWLLHEARHTAIVLPRDERTAVEYGFGSLAWYAQGEDAWYDAFGTVLWPNRGTLGRREVARDAAGAPVYPAGSRIDELTVSRERADALRERLDERFEAGRAAGTVYRRWNLDFVEDPRRFWAFDNCHDAVAGWFEDLGCRVSWVPVRAGIETADRPGP